MRILSNTRHPFRRPPLSFVTTTLLTALSLTFSTYAQQYVTPVPVTGPAFARTSTKLYILSGRPSTNNAIPALGQFLSLDLAVPFNSSSPPFKKLQDGPMQAIFPGVFTADQKTMIVFHIPGSYSVYKYSIDTDKWTPSPISFPEADFQGINAVTDPISGLVYLASGYTENNRGVIDVYDPSTDTAIQFVMPTTFEARRYYQNVWSKQRKSILYFGGYTAGLGSASNVVTEFIPSNRTWGTLTTTGVGPSPRADHCMTSNDDGTRVVVYGGLPIGGRGNGEVFILNTTTGEWKQGTSGQPRQYTTCTIAGDQLLIWGGTVPGNIVSPASVLIYNITADIWTDNYIPPASYVTPPSANTTTSPSPTVSNTGPETGAQEDGKSNVGAIVGGVVGALAVIGTIIWFLLYRRRQHRPIPVKTTLDHDESAGSTPMSGSGSPHTNITSPEEELKRMQSQLENHQRQLLALQQPLLLQSPPLAPQDLSGLYGCQLPTSYPATTIATLNPTLNTVQALPNASSPPLDPQDLSGLYGCQPPTFYPATTTTTLTPTLNTVQALPNASSPSLYAYSRAVPTVSAARGNGSQSDLNQNTTETSYTPSPLVYMPANYMLPPMSHVSSSTASIPVVATPAKNLHLRP